MEGLPSRIPHYRVDLDRVKSIIDVPVKVGSRSLRREGRLTQQKAADIAMRFFTQIDTRAYDNEHIKAADGTKLSLDLYGQDNETTFGYILSPTDRKITLYITNNEDRSTYTKATFNIDNDEFLSAEAHEATQREMAPSDVGRTVRPKPSIGSFFQGSEIFDINPLTNTSPALRRVGDLAAQIPAEGDGPGDLQQATDLYKEKISEQYVTLIDKELNNLKGKIEQGARGEVAKLLTEGPFHKIGKNLPVVGKIFSENQQKKGLERYKNTEEGRSYDLKERDFIAARNQLVSTDDDDVAAARQALKSAGELVTDEKLLALEADVQIAVIAQLINKNGFTDEFGVLWGKDSLVPKEDYHVSGDDHQLDTAMLLAQRVAEGNHLGHGELANNTMYDVDLTKAAHIAGITACDPKDSIRAGGVLPPAENPASGDAHILGSHSIDHSRASVRTRSLSGLSSGSEEDYYNPFVNGALGTGEPNPFVDEASRRGEHNPFDKYEDPLVESARREWDTADEMFPDDAYDPMRVSAEVEPQDLGLERLQIELAGHRRELSSARKQLETATVDEKGELLNRIVELEQEIDRIAHEIAFASYNPPVGERREEPLSSKSADDPFEGFLDESQKSRVTDEAALGDVFSYPQEEGPQDAALSERLKRHSTSMTQKAADILQRLNERLEYFQVFQQEYQTAFKKASGAEKNGLLLELKRVNAKILAILEETKSVKESQLAQITELETQLFIDPTIQALDEKSRTDLAAQGLQLEKEIAQLNKSIGTLAAPADSSSSAASQTETDELSASQKTEARGEAAESTSQSNFMEKDEFMRKLHAAEEEGEQKLAETRAQDERDLKELEDEVEQQDALKAASAPKAKKIVKKNFKNAKEIADYITKETKLTIPAKIKDNTRRAQILINRLARRMRLKLTAIRTEKILIETQERAKERHVGNKIKQESFDVKIQEAENRQKDHRIELNKYHDAYKAIKQAGIDLKLIKPKKRS